MLTAVKNEYIEISRNEKERSLENHKAHLQDFRSDIDLLLMNLVESINKQTESLVKAKDFAIKELEEGLNAKVHAVESHLREKEELLKSRDGQLEALRSEVTALTERMAEMESANKQVQGLLQEEVRRKEEVLQAKDFAIKELEEGLNAKVHAVESHLREKEELLKSRDGQLEALRFEKRRCWRQNTSTNWLIKCLAIRSVPLPAP
jgi:chromosome segregation ATPase